MLRQDKERLVAELTERLRSSETLIVADYRGLSVDEIDKLRSELLRHGARFSVVKNTLTKRAAEAAGTTELLALLDGPTAIAFLETEGDPVAVAKALNDAAKAEVLTIKGGVLEGASIPPEAVKQLASLPPVDTLRSQVAGAIVSPLTTFVALLSAPLHDLVGLIDARIRQLEEREERTPEPEAQAAAEPEAPAEAEAAAEPEPSAEAEAAAEPEPSPEAEAAAEPEPPPEAEAAAEAEPSPDVEPAPEPEETTEEQKQKEE